MKSKIEYQSFSQSIRDELGYYVYAYVDVSDKMHEKIIYVGKGKGNRCFDHLKSAVETDKTQTIKNLDSQGFLRVDILVYGLEDEDTALKVEAATIDAIGIENLKNAQRGHGSADYGRISTDGLSRKLKKIQLKEGDFKENCILIKIQKLYSSSMPELELYEATRGAWRVSKSSCEKAKYACAVYDGVIQEVYAIAGWFQAGQTFYSTRDIMNNDESRSTRLEFVGQIASEAIREQYCYKGIKDIWANGAQNPIAYFGPDFL